MGATLVTGANGLIGYAAARRLTAAGHTVIGMDRMPLDNPDPGFPVVVSDLADTHRLYATMRTHGVERVLHAGGISGPMLLRDNPAQVFEINVAGTLSLIEAARITQAKRFVFLSSFVTYGEQPDDSPVREDRTLAAVDPYACSKVAAEAVLRAYREQHDMQCVALRLAGVYGPRRITTCLIRLMLENALDGRDTRLEFGADRYRQFVHVDDIVDAVCRALDTPFARIREHAYNVSGGVWQTLDEVARVAAAAVPGVKVSLQAGHNPLDYHIGPLDLSAIARDLGYVPRIELADGIASYHAWLKANRPPN